MCGKTTLRYLWGLLTLFIILKFFSTPVTAPNYYPFVFSDTWQYVSQGLHYLGEPIPDYYRPPAFPLFITLLYKLGAEQYLGFIPHVFSIVLVISTFLLTEKLFGRKTAFFVSFLSLANKQIFIYSYLLNADIICVALITLSTALVFFEKRWAIICAWMISALSFYAQNALFAPILLVLTIIFVQGKHFYKKRENMIGLIIFCLFIIIYLVIFFDYKSSSARHIKWLSFMKFQHVIYYLRGIFFELHFSGMVLIAVGSVVVWIEQRKQAFFLCACLFLPFFFFTFFYHYEYQRFILYYNIPLMIMMGHGLSEITRKLKIRFFGYIIIFIVLWYQNTPGFSQSLRFDNTAMALTPHLSLVNDWTLTKEDNSPMLLQIMRSSVEELNARGSFNLFPETTDALSKDLHGMLDVNDVFTVFPFIRPEIRGQFSEKIQVLARRNYVKFRDADLNSQKLKALIYLRVPDNIYTEIERTERDRVLNYINTSGDWQLHRYNEYIHLYYK